MDINGFQSEVKNDPLGRGYNDMSNEQLWESLQTLNRSKLVALGSRTLLEWAAYNSRYQKLENVANDAGAGDAVRSICKAALKILDRADTQLDLNYPEHMALLDGLVASGVLSSDDKDSLVASSTVAISRAEEINCKDMDFNYMVYLKGLIA